MYSTLPPPQPPTETQDSEPKSDSTSKARSQIQSTVQQQLQKEAQPRSSQPAHSEAQPQPPSQPKSSPPSQPQPKPQSQPQPPLHPFSTQLDLPAGPFRFANRALFNAVRHVSNDLIKRSTLSVSDPRYASLLSDILGRSHYATIERLAHQRRLAAAATQAVTDASASRSPTATSSSSSSSSTQSSPGKKRQRPSRKDLDKLVARMRAPRRVADGERSLTLDIIHRDGDTLDVDALRRLWGVPKVVADVAGLPSFLRSAPRAIVVSLYDRLIASASPDMRVFNLLAWAERYVSDNPIVEGKETPNSTTSSSSKSAAHCNVMQDRDENIRSVSRGIVASVIRALLTKRPSPFFTRHMDVAVETVLYAIHPDRFVPRFRAAMLRDAGFCRGLQAYEYSWSYEGSLENLAKGRLNRMLKDIRAVRALDPPQVHARHSTGGSTLNQSASSAPRSGATGAKSTKDPKANPVAAGLSLRAVRKYCAERDTLTDRALRAVHDRYVRRRRSITNGHAGGTGAGPGTRMRIRSKRENGRRSIERHEGTNNSSVGLRKAETAGDMGGCMNTIGTSPTRPASSWFVSDDARMTVGDFVRMYLALVGCGSDPGLKYWFGVLDQDGDGLVGVGDVAHFYAERKAESERRNGVLLADVHWLWVRLCAMSGTRPDGPGLDLNAFKSLRKEEREFVMCALLVRRVDDGKLADVASTIRASGDSGAVRIGTAM